MKIKYYFTPKKQEIRVVQFHWYNKRKTIKWCLTESSLNGIMNTDYFEKYTHDIMEMKYGCYLAVSSKGNPFIINKKDLKKHFIKTI